jgi:competence protein ComEC
MPLLWLSLAFLGGIVLAESVAMPAWFWACLVGGMLLVWGITRRLRHFQKIQRVVELFSHKPFFRLAGQALAKVPVPTALLLAVVFAGAARYQLAQPKFTSASLAWYNDREEIVTLEGVVIDPPDERDSYTNLRVAVDGLRVAEQIAYTPVEGKALVRLPPGGNWDYGDRISLTGKLETPQAEEGFSYRDYLRRQGIYTQIQPVQASLLLKNQGNLFRAAVFGMKERLLSTVYRIFPDPEASLMAGILLGVESGIPQDVQDAFEATGTTHIIAISGFNIAILAGLFTLLFSRLVGRWWGALLAAVGIALYTILVGAGASVVRAAVMGWLSLLAVQIGRRQNGLNSLGIVAGVMAFFSPTILWDVGFQLSFMATLGLVLYADPIQGAFERLTERWLPAPLVERAGKLVGETVLLTLAAQVLVLPVIVYHFQRLSLTMLVANPLILPVQPAVMVLGGLAMLAGLVFQPLGQILGYLAWPFVAYTIRAVEGLAGIPGGAVSLGNVPILWMVLFYALVFLLTFARASPDNRWSAWMKSLNPGVPLAGLAVLTVLVWRQAYAAPDGTLHLTVLDVSLGGLSGEALLVQTPDGRSLLINGGPSASRLSEALGRRLPLWGDKLDVLVVAGVQNGQLQALPTVVERAPPQQVLWAGLTQASRASRDLQEKLVELQTPWKDAGAGQALNLGSGAYLRVLAVGERGAVLLLEWQDFRALLPVGMSFEEMETLEMGKRVGRVSALLLADSGYAPLNSPEWIANLHPQVILLSVSLKDVTGLPSPETLKAVEGYTLLRTDRNGWIELSTDGVQMWVEAEK